MRVTTSWIFNRLCDEPDRLKAKLVTDANNRETHTISSIAELVDKYNNILRWEQDVAQLRLESPAELTIVSDHAYIKVNN